MKRLGAVAVLVLAFVALAAMRWTMPRYARITGPIDYAGKPGVPVRTDNLQITAGAPRLARTIRFGASGKIETRDSDGVWLIVPIFSEVEHRTAHVYGRTWVATDGRRYRASGRVETADAALSSTKTIQPGLQRKDLLVFELPPELATGGTLLLSEERDPQLTAEARIRYPATPLAPPAAMLDLDDLHAKL